MRKHYVIFLLRFDRKCQLQISPQCSSIWPSRREYGRMVSNYQLIHTWLNARSFYGVAIHFVTRISREGRSFVAVTQHHQQITATKVSRHIKVCLHIAQLASMLCLAKFQGLRVALASLKESAIFTQGKYWGAISTDHMNERPGCHLFKH